MRNDFLTFLRRVRSEAQEAMEEAGEEVFNQSLMEVPRDTEQLAESAELEPLEGQIGVVISFGDEVLRFGNTVPSKTYALYQHEDQTLNHPQGGKAKYLEHPTYQKGPRAIEKALRKRLGRLM